MLPQAEKATVTTPVEVATPQGSPVELSQIDLERAKRSGCCVYALEYDLIHDIERQGRNVLQLFHQLEECGEILDVALDFTAVGGLDAAIGNRLPLAIIFATLTVPTAIGGLTRTAGGADQSALRCLRPAKPGMFPRPLRLRGIEPPAPQSRSRRLCRRLPRQLFACPEVHSPALRRQAAAAAQRLPASAGQLRRRRRKTPCG